MLGKRTLAGQYNTKTASITGFKIDKTGPSVSVSFKKADNTAYTPGTWSTQNIIQTLSGNDNGGSGVSYFQYSENSGTATNTSSGDSWSVDRNSKVKFRAVDAVGNAGAWTSEYNLMIDKTAPPVPVMSGTHSGTWVNYNYAVTLSSTDSISGIARYEVSTNGSSWSTYTNPTTYSTEGNFKYYYRAVNKAGLASYATSANRVMIDKQAPYISDLAVAGVARQQSVRSWYLQASFKGTLVDDLSGVLTNTERLCETRVVLGG